MVQRLAKFELEPVAKGLLETLENLLKAKDIEFSREAEFQQKDIVEFDSRMRVCGLEKFNDPSYIAAVNYYLSEQDKKDNNACGVLILYVEAEVADKFFKKIGLKPKGHEDEAYLESMVVFCGMVVDSFKSALSTLGLPNLVTSEPIKAFGDIPEGVDFHYGEYKYYEMGFYSFKQKMIVASLSLAPVSLK